MRRHLDLIGTDYKFYDGKKGIARTKHKDVMGKDDNSPRVNWGMWFKNKATQIRWYTDPSFVNNYSRYEYKKIEPETVDDTIQINERLVRSSFIPYIKIKNEKYWLLGSFYDFPEIKVDFGGKCRRTEEPIDCADRELEEETHGVLVDPIDKALIDNRTTVFKGYNKNNNPHHSNKRVIFILVDMTDKLDELDKIQSDINTATPLNAKEKFGPLGFYREKDIFKGIDSNNNEKMYTSYSLTDFINFYKNS